MALHRVCGTLKNFEKVHIVDIIQMQNHSTGKRLMLPNNIIVLSQYGNIIVKKNNSVDKSGKYSYALDFGTNNIEKLKLNIKIKKTSKCSRTNNKFVQFFDLDKLKGSITIRNRQKGDKFIPLGMSGKRKLKDFFMDLKIPRSERENIPLICFGEDIGWVVGYRISDDFKVDRNTKNILAISFEREEL
jgi:tRNA(Ile)-lysidine synthase